MKKILLILISSATILVSCKKDNPVITPPTPPKLYVCGTEWNTITNSQQAKVWIDGVGTYWSNSTGGQESLGNKLFVTDAGDVYLSGAIKNTQWRAVYWKNGIATYLTDGTYEAGAGGGVFVNGNDVYACGGERNAANVFSAKYWKNGTAVSLTDGTKESVANSIFVSGTDVYVVGYEQNAAGDLKAKYWKNGTEIALGVGRTANSIVVSGSDVYIVGDEDATSSFGFYWKNGTLISLNNCVSAKKIFLSGSDVYVAGYDNNSNAAYWKNGTATVLSNGYSANSIFVSGSDVYVAGVGLDYKCRFWKNGAETVLSTITNYHNQANDIIYK